MFNIKKVELEFAGRKLTLETGKIARQAASVMVTYGDTMVLCNAVAAKSIKPGQNFFPLTVNYQEKHYATGRIPGSFHRREGRPAESETLVSRLIDRPIRPLFPEEFLNEVQVTATVLSHDMENTPDIAAMIGCSAALAISGVPFMGPIAGTRVGYKDGAYILNPTLQEREGSLLDLIVAGTKEGVLMVESEAQELSEDVMLGAVTFGWKSFQPVIEAINKLKAQVGAEAWPVPEVPAAIKAMATAMKSKYAAQVAEAYKEPLKAKRYENVGKVREAVVAEFVKEDTELTKEVVESKFHALEADVVRNNILDTKKRIDGRGTKDIRNIVCETGLLPRVHGSALFTRGETQAIVTTTLGTGQDEQLIDGLEGEYKEKFLLHYNFPPYSVGETGRMGSPGRREIGHGKLAWRAIRPLLPANEDFPYTLRIVSEITESNGSSSMATVCGSSLALMDAGVPLKAPVAGIAMGLIKEGDKYAVLSDILGDEDHLGDMDFKVAGTEKGITALQMDLKITSISEEIMRVAVEQAHAGRKHILGKMSEALTDARDEISRYAPQMAVLTIPTDKIRDVIGTGGKVIREIIEQTGTKIDISDDGTVKIAAPDVEAIERAVEIIKGITEDPEVGKVYNGKVVKTADFGAFVNFMKEKDGLVHISELANERVNKTTDIVKEGDLVKVLLVGFDDRGKIKLSMKRVNQETGEILPKPERAEMKEAG